MEISDKKGLQEAVRRLEPEITIVDPKLAKSVQLMNALRLAATIIVVVILAIAAFMVINPLGWDVLEQPQSVTVKNILLGLGILLLFAEYLMPVARLYKVVNKDPNGLKLVPRKQR